MEFRKQTIAVAVLGACAPLAAFAAPTVSWKAPNSGATMYGAYSNSSQCEVTGSGISRVKFYVDVKAPKLDIGFRVHVSPDWERGGRRTHLACFRRLSSRPSQLSIRARRGVCPRGTGR